MVIGGLVPRLLLDDKRLDPALQVSDHPGTNDVDLCVELDVPGDGDQFYQYLQQVLEENGFSPASLQNGTERSVWRWVRKVGHVSVLIELLTDADSVMTDIGGATIGRLTRDARTGNGDEIGALRIRGAHLALADPVIRTIEIELLDGRGVAQVDVRVANLLAFVVLKTFAVKGRTKDKDTFDLIWVLTYWPAGPAAAAAHARECPCAEHPVVVEAMQLLEQEFATPAHNGCVRYADFSMGPGVGRSSELHTLRCRDAHATIRAFLAAWQASDPQLPLMP